MRKPRWTRTIAPASAGIAAGAVIVVLDATALAIGCTLVIVSLITLLYARMRDWATDTSAEREQLRAATVRAEEERTQAITGHAIQLAERERLRAEDAERQRAADDAHEAARSSVAQAHADAEQRIAEERARIEDEFEQQRAEIMVFAYRQGVTHALSGQLDQIREHDATIVQLRPRAIPASSRADRSG
jgi:hypothetical protein